MKAIIIWVVFFLAGCRSVPVRKYDTSLAAELNRYRERLGLAPIPVSSALTRVAETHVYDLYCRKPYGNACNLHSWSNKGKWSACCYTSDHQQAECMWSKPRELTDYTGNGYEIAACASENITPERALTLWQNSPHHHEVIINTGQWTDKSWQAMGAAIFKTYAVVWFGMEVDQTDGSSSQRFVIFDQTPIEIIPDNTAPAEIIEIVPDFR